MDYMFLDEIHEGMPLGFAMDIHLTLWWLVVDLYIFFTERSP